MCHSWDRNLNLPTLLQVWSRQCQQTWQHGTLELEPPRDLKGRLGFPFTFMFYECWGNVGCLLIIKAVFMTSPKANKKKKKKKRKGSKCIPFRLGWKVDLSCTRGTAWFAALENTTRKHVQEDEKLWSGKPDGACCHQWWGADSAWCDRPVCCPWVE